MKSVKGFKQLGLAIIVLSLAGCATRPIAPVVTVPSTASQLTWPQRMAQLNAIKNWNLNSVLSVREAHQVNFVSLNWQQQGDQYLQTIAGPFNLGGVRIVGKPGNVSLWKSQQQQITASSPEELFYKELKLNLPISNMFYWVRGLPVPNQTTKQQLDSQQRLTNLQQNGWNIQYVEYQQVKGIALPRTILLNNNTIRVKMIIKSWQIN